MRCLTLAESLVERGHHVSLMGAVNAVPWLLRRFAEVDIELISCEPDSLDVGFLKSHPTDWLVVDSYWIAAEKISRANTEVSVLAIIDGDDRGIDASLYLDQNLGADLLEWRDRVSSRLLGGSSYALIRDGILAQRREFPNLVRHSPSRVIAFMGGSDPRGAIAAVVGALVAANLEIELTAICPPATFMTVSELASHHSWVSVIEPTNELPRLLADADAVISASGTSAWELCTLGIPSLLIAVVDNQRQALANAQAAGVALGIDAIASIDVLQGDIGPALHRLVHEPSLRRNITTRCRDLFDGAGKVRVVEAMERGRP